MIAYVEGRVAELTEQSCVLITESGVGYEIFLTPTTLSECKKGSELTHYYICSVVREDAFELFGFKTWAERESFILLRGINRVGPRTALAILSVFSPDDLIHLVADEDVMSLTQVPGIGKKTAQSVFIELKYKLKDKVPSTEALAGSTDPHVLSDAVAGLMNLGYAENESHKAVKQVLGKSPDLEVGEALREALKLMARG